MAKTSLLQGALAAIIWPRFVAGTLLYPASTVFQVGTSIYIDTTIRKLLISSVGVPITDLPPNRKAFFDWGFQMNYDMPFNVSSFYNVPIWASRGNEISKRDIYAHDFTPTDFNEGLENALQRYGFHRTCWKRSICELARHPFDEADRHFFTDLITFVMTPSLSEIFAPEDDSNAYKVAERQGLAGQRCHHLYPECVDDILDALTTINYKTDQ